MATIEQKLWGKTPDGKEIKIAYGCRATKAIGKLAKAFGIDEGFEEFRIAEAHDGND